MVGWCPTYPRPGFLVQRVELIADVLHLDVDHVVELRAEPLPCLGDLLVGRLLQLLGCLRLGLGLGSGLKTMGKRVSSRSGKDRHFMM